MAKTKAIITDEVSLPSKGLLYGGRIPDTLTMRPMTVNELKILYGSASTMVALNSILKEVITNVKDFNVDELLLDDKYYLAYQLRIMTFGEMYDADVRCPHCGKEDHVQFNLSELKVNELPDDYVDPHSIGKLPKSGDVIETKLLRVGDFSKIIKRSTEIRKQFPDFEGEPTYHLSLAAQVATVNGEKKASRDMEQYILDMHAVDAMFLQKKLNELEFGLDVAVTHECKSCGEEMNLQLAIGEDFFRPELEF